MSKKTSHYPRPSRLHEKGLVSITVTMVLMIVLSLIVLGFARISGRNQRQALDQQLSTQAFYAAESGINDVRNLVKLAGAGATVPPKNTCPSGGGGGFYNSLNSSVNGALGASYTCLLVNPAPATLVYGNIGDQSTIVPLNAETGNLTSVRFNWKSTTSTTPMTGCPPDTDRRFLPTASWTCGYGVLRFDLVPTDGSFDINELSNNTMTSFAVPTSGGTNNVAFTAGSNNDVIGVHCSNADCNLTVNLPGSAPSYYLRVSSLYKSVALEISGRNAGGSVNLKGAQAMVDSTGKAQDVLRRIQVRLPLADTSRNKLPDYAIQSTDSICKKFSIMQGYFVNDPSLGGITSTNPMCQITAAPTPPTTPTTPTPPTTPIPPDPDADALIEPCTAGCGSDDDDDGDGGDDGPRAHPLSWNRGFKNRSSNTSPVVSCEWFWGDGTSTPNKSCELGETITHAYAHDPTCKVFTVTLRLVLQNGLTPAHTYRTYVPHGDGTTPC